MLTTFHVGVYLSSVNQALAYEYSWYKFVSDLITVNGSTHLMNIMAGGLLTTMIDVCSSSSMIWSSVFLL